MDDRAQLTREDIREIITGVLDERNRVDGETHVDHHRFIGSEIERRADRKRLIEQVKQQVVGWGIIVALGLIGSAVYSYVMGGKS